MQSRRSIQLIVALVSLTVLTLPPTSGADPQPNIVFILADDLGYGDVKCFGQDRCQIETPNFDRLAREGMRFTDAHANASVCVPTRVAIMTGRYPWRFAPPARGGPWGFLSTRFSPDQHTLGTMMKSAGYRTGYVGKWHLGTLMTTLDGKTQGPTNVHYTKPLEIGPKDYGFDDSFVLPGSLDMYPYAFVRDNRWVGEVTAQKGWSAFNRVGPAAEDFEDTKVLDTFCKEAKRFVDESSGNEHAPFFLFVALTAPHTPTSPSAEFEGKSRIGLYGDFVMETDDCVGRVLDTLEAAGVADNTLVIATSDHGPASYAGRRREATYLQLKELEKEGHFSGGPYRGYKFSVYEGGLRVPFVARWPGVVPKGTSCDHLVALQDLMATAAEIAGVTLETNQAPDSISMLPLLKDPASSPTRDSMLLESTRNRAVRSGGWKLALCPGSGTEGRWGNTPKQADAWKDALKTYARNPKSHDELLQAPFVQLFYLPDDPGETNNLAARRPEKVRELAKILESQIKEGRSTPGPTLKNDRDNIKAFSSVPAFVWNKPSGEGGADRGTVDCVETDDAIVVKVNGKTVLRYNKSIQQSPEGIDPVYARSGYIHPVYSPNGMEVTGDFAPDHAHQHALFNAWTRTTFEGRKVDFWNQRAQQGRVSHERVLSVASGENSGRFVVQLLHEDLTGDDGPAPVLRETWTVTAAPVSKRFFQFEIESSQVCIAESPLTINEYHYGGMALRGNTNWLTSQGIEASQAYQKELKVNPDSKPPALDVVPHQFLTSEGLRRIAGNHSRPNWVDLFGVIDDRTAGIAVLAHRSNFRSPQAVRLHPVKPYFCYAPMVDGDFQIKPGRPYVSRFRYIVHDGAPDVNLLNRQWEQFQTK